MKAHLMFADRDFHADEPAPEGADDLEQDLELTALIQAMSGGDKLLAQIARTALVHPLAEIDAIGYRQDMLEDALAHPALVSEIFDLAGEAIARQRRVFSWLTGSPTGILQHSIEVLEIFVAELKLLRRIAEQNRDVVRSAAFTRFFGMILTELDDAYFDEIDAHLHRLRLRDGVLFSARLDERGGADALVLRRPLKDRLSLSERVSALTHPDPSFRIADRDEAGANALTRLRGRGVNPVAAALARSTDHILAFFRMLRDELGFYVGCTRAAGMLEARGLPHARPALRPAGSAALQAHGLYDVALALVSDAAIVGNDVEAAERDLVVITGVNSGGKSTLLRAIGQAQLMAQCGMFAAASELAVTVRPAVFTHFKREEDEELTGGKLDEELARMSSIADRLTPGALVLFNESFASTNEREGSEIARQVVHALLEREVGVVYVTHMYDLSHGLAVEARSDAGARSGDHGIRALFLRAEQARDFRLVPGEPLPTSHGQDVYHRVFGRDPKADAEQPDSPDNTDNTDSPTDERTPSCAT